MDSIGKSPFLHFSDWLNKASGDERISEPTAMTLATASKSGQPSARIVLLKSFDEQGFIFYTNMESRKSQELAANTLASLSFYWMPLEQQVRIEGKVTRVNDTEADAYFATRPRESQIGAWASQQSRHLETRNQLEARFSEFSEKYANLPVPRPPHWSGWRLNPHYFEFWQAGAHRLHERHIFKKNNENSWIFELLYP